MKLSEIIEKYIIRRVDFMNIESKKEIFFHFTKVSGISGLKINCKKIVILFILGISFANLYSQSPTGYIPVGTVVAHGSTSVPTGWLLCDGTSYTQAAYPALYAVIGTTFGTGANDFMVPNMQGRFARGANPGQVNTNAPSTSLGTFQEDAYISHGHSIGSFVASNSEVGVSHRHSHNHGTVTSTSANFQHSHTLGTTTTSKSDDASSSHNHTTDSYSHKHQFKQFTTGVTNFMSQTGGVSGVWANITTSAIPSAYNDPRGAHSHSGIGNSNATHTHSVAGTTGAASATTHYHAFNLSITSNASTTHTHTISGSTANDGTGTDTYPDNVSFNFIIKY